VGSTNLLNFPTAKVPTPAELAGGAQYLIRYGPRLNVEIHMPDPLVALLQQKNQPVPPPIVAKALIDTGASATCVDEQSIAPLGLTVIRQMPVCSPGGNRNVNVYPVKFTFPGTDLKDVDFAPVGACDLQAFGVVALLGRDFLSGKTLVYNGELSIVTLCW
jgi:hypothetical protein